MLMGVVAGIGVATAGGVAGFAMLGKQSQSEQDVAMIQSDPAPLDAAPAAAPAAPTQQPAAAPAPRPAAQPAAPRPAARPTPQPVQTIAAQPAVPAEECWDEEVTVTEDPKDQHAIAGTALGAVVGGKLGNEVGDSDLSTAAGAAAGAFIGRRLQRRMQENREEQRTTTTTVRRCAPTGSR
jgi:uncharacterized protein YcfJ